MPVVSLIKAVKKLLILWLCCSLFLLLIVFFQDLSGDKYIFNDTAKGRRIDESPIVWRWFLINILPCNLLILFAYFRHKKLSVLRLSSSELLLYRIVFWLSAAYLCTVITTLLMVPVGNLEKSEAQKLVSSVMGLYIFQGLLLASLSVFIYLTEKSFAASNTESLDEFSGEPGVFISYNHQDKVVANQLKEMLESKNIPVKIDSDDMVAGENIQSFIEKSVLNTRTTISIVSNKSLLSDWVGMETVSVFFLKNFFKKKQFIACYIDADFFDLKFTANAVMLIDEKLGILESQIKKQSELRVDTRDLNDSKTRLLMLRNNMDDIMKHLRGSLCIDISNGKLENNFDLIRNSINVN